MEITVQQAADKLGVTRARVRQFILAGRINVRYVTPHLILIDEKQLAKVRNRRPGRPWPKKKGR
ncbi:MAG: hypothetical protein ABSB33_06740 [Tepidisphaeraceae bacterium]|jgi:hypothetical protein